MFNTLLQILPLTLVASLSPTALMAEAAILGGKGEDVRKNTLLFVAGAALFLATLGLLIMFVFRHTVVRLDYRPQLSASIDILLGLLILLILFLSLPGKRNQPRAAAQPQRKRPYLVMGLLIMLINTSTEVPFIAASKIIADSGLPLVELAVLFTAQMLITMWMLVLPLVFSYAAPERSTVMLGRLSGIMRSYGPNLIRALFAAVGVYLIWKGIWGVGS